MNLFSIIFFIYICLISIISAAVTVYDKLCAVKHKWRIKESTLIVLSALGGSAAMFITMLLIGHKTRHIKFMLGIPIIFVIQAAIVYFVRRAAYV